MHCRRPCRTLSGNDWNIVLPNIHEQIIFLDEENKFVRSQEFAEAVPNLPYSVDEIYGIHTSGRYHDLKRTYNELYHIYSAELFYKEQTPATVVVEDANSGYEFFSVICEENFYKTEKNC